eukprot:COSAG01_NODE_68553_length_263_cov_17.036585_1_plen_45_part_10
MLSALFAVLVMTLTASPPQALSPGDVARAHGPARPDPGPPSAQTP